MDDVANAVQDQKGKSRNGERRVPEFDQLKASLRELEKDPEAPENPYRAALDSMSDAIYTVDRDLRIVTVDKRPTSWLEHQGKDIVGRLVAEAFPFLPRTVSDQYREAFETGRIVVTEETITVHQKGRLVEMRKIPIQEDGRITKILTVLRDVTQARRTGPPLLSERNALKSMIDAMPFGITLQDRECNVLFHNESIKTMFGESVGTKCYKNYELNNQVCEDCPVELSFRDGASHRKERLVTAQNGESLVLENTAIAIKNDCGNISSCLEIVVDITRQKRAEEDLRESRERTKRLFMTSPVPQVIMDPGTGAFVDCNDAAVQIYGYESREETLGKKPIDVSPQTQYDGSESPMMATKRIEACWRDGVHIFEWRHQRPDGQMWDANVHMMLFRFHRKPYVQFTLHDITEHRKALDALRKAEEKYRTIFENAVMGIFQTSLQGRVVVANPALARIFGYNSPQELMDSLTDIATQAYVDNQEFMRVREICFKQGFVEGYETQFRRKDKSARWVSINARPINDAEGRAVYFEGTIEDIDERKRAEEALRQSEEMYRTLIAASPDPITVTDLSGRVTLGSPKSRELFGVSESHGIGRCILEWVSPEDQPKARAAMQQLLTTGEFPFGELALKKDDGTLFDAEVHAAPILSSNGTARGVIFITRDITERKNLQAQLLQAQKMEAIGTLAGGVAHDFNNILMAIMGYAGLMETKITEDHLLRNYVHQINSCTSKAANVTRSLLAFSRKQTMELQPQSTNMILRDLEKLLKRLVPEDVKFTVSLNEDVPIMADMTQIDQVLINLISNAKDAMPKGGTLHIETKAVELGKEFKQAHGFGEPGRYAMISVTDTGSGMDEATEKKIFEPFFTTKGVGKGTGLGLSIVYGIIKQHSGYITVLSQPGKGTTFEIYLPAVKEAIFESGQASIRAQGGTETILLAEDNNEVRGTVRAILGAAGYAVVDARDGEDAVRQYRDHRDTIDLLILDVVMPGKNGKEAYEEMRSINPSVRALFMSGYTGDVVLDKGLQDTTVNYISKPISADELLKLIREVLER